VGDLPTFPARFMNLLGYSAGSCKRPVRRRDLVGIDEPEPNARDVVRSTDNRLLIAGPEAGKTKLWAQ
jgi:hypothetical protein